MSPIGGVVKELDQGPQAPSETGPPTSEIGTLTPWAPGIAGWATYVGDDLEKAPALQWPQSVRTYQQMRTDAQVQGLYLGTTLPLRRYHWSIDPNGCNPTKVAQLAANLNLPLKDAAPQPVKRSQGFVFKQHLTDALLSLIFGHYPFELVGTIANGGMWTLTGAKPRPPETISVINLTPGGELQSFMQYFSQRTENSNAPMTIGAERTVWYAWQKEGANWPGRSMLRACYRNWLRKDRLLRVDAQKNERNGVGLPHAEAPPNTSAGAVGRLDRQMQRLRAGDMSGLATPNGTKVSLMGVSGTLPDTVASIHLDNEEMARAWLAMFMQLGQTETGSRALGSEFIDFFSDAVDEIGSWFCETFTDRLIASWWGWNVEEDPDQVPLLVYTRNPDSAFVGRDFAQLVHYGAITVDEELENSIRERYGLPMRQAGDELPAGPQGAIFPNETTPVPTTSSATARRGRAAMATGLDGAPAVMLPSRPLRRQLYAHEIQASVDWATLDMTWQLARDQLVSAVSQLQFTQIDELHDQIVEAGNNLDALNAIQAPANMEDTIYQAMVAIAHQGAADAQAEAARQSKTVNLPDLVTLGESQKTRASVLAEFLANSISAAARSNAIRFAGGKLTGAEIADKVKTKLDSLSKTYLSDTLGGGLTAAMNSGRKATMDNNLPKDIYASEIMDDHTCENCIMEDGTQFVNLDDAERDYPGGGFVDCLGGARCRGTLVAVYSDETVATVE